VALANEFPVKEFSRSLDTIALPDLESALQRDKSDLPALEAKGNALWETGFEEKALETFEKALELAPDREQALFQAARLNLRLKRFETARMQVEQLIAMSPWRWRYHLLLGQIRGQGDDWVAAQQAANKALELNPAELSVRQYLVLCHLRLGERAQAQKDFDTLLAMNPPQPEILRRWFADVSRATNK
jgi:tetratricopeptide (TPR) repeat protein